MIDKLELIKDENISSKIYNIRGLQVMLARGQYSIKQKQEP